MDFVFAAIKAQFFHRVLHCRIINMCLNIHIELRLLGDASTNIGFKLGQIDPICCESTQGFVKRGWHASQLKHQRCDQITANSWN